MTVEQVNQLGPDEFVEKIGPIFENSPWIASATFNSRPFESRNQLLQELCDMVGGSSVDDQIKLISAHPDLAGRLADAGELTEESTREQAAAGLSDADEEIRSSIKLSNVQYRKKFGFPFVICARLSNIQTIQESFQSRLEQTRETEIDTALSEIYKIARLRLFDIVD